MNGSESDASRRQEGAGEIDPRVALAAERTLLAWIRTGLSLMGFGFVVAKFGLFLREIAPNAIAAPRPASGASLWIGTALTVLGVIVNVTATVHHVRLIRRLQAGERHRAAPAWAAVVIALALALLGAGIAAYLFLNSR